MGRAEMNASCRSKMSGPSLSNPTMNPAYTSSPARVSTSTARSCGMRRFWVFFAWARASREGVSIPTNT
jgi:hypothetical protein